MCTTSYRGLNNLAKSAIFSFFKHTFYNIFRKLYFWTFFKEQRANKLPKYHDFGNRKMILDKLKLLRKRRNLLRLFIDITVTDKSIMADVELKIYCLVIEVIQCMGDLLSKKSLKYRQKEVLNTVLFFHT